jgi:hypothetical protein
MQPKKTEKMLIAALLLFLLIAPAAMSVLVSNVVVGSSGTISLTNSLQLHVSGNKILNSGGNVVRLRGVDYTYFMDTPDGSWMGSDGVIHWDGTPSTRDNFLTADIGQFLDGMASWKVNCIRVFITIQFWTQDTLQYKNNIKYFIAQCASRGIYVLFVPWRVSSSTSEVFGALPYPPYAQGSSADTAIIGSAAAFVNYWGSVANELKGYNNVVFELWNEPGWYYGQAGVDSWFSTTQLCINAIRTAGATNLVDIEFDGPPTYNAQTGWTQDWGWVTGYPLTDSVGNLIYDMHIYSEACILANGQRGYQMADVTTWLTRAGEFSMAQQKPLMAGEFGCNMWANEQGYSQANENTWFSNTMTLLDQYGIGYCAFAGPPWAYGGSSSQWSLVYANQANYAPTASGAILKAHLAT